MRTSRLSLGNPSWLPAIAVDGKAVRGAAGDDGLIPYLLAAVTHGTGTVLAERLIGPKTNGKMSGLWSGHPPSVKLDELDVICAVVGCGIGDLLIPEPGKVAMPGGAVPGLPPAASAGAGDPPARSPPGAATGGPSRRHDRLPAPRQATIELRGLPGLGTAGPSPLRRLHHVPARPPGQCGCAGCGRVLAIKNGYCRLCWQQADAEAKAAGGLPRGAISALAMHPGGLAFHQLFFDRMKHRRSLPAPAGPPQEPAGHLPPPPPGRPAASGPQLALFQVRRDLTRSGTASGTGSGSPWLAWGLHIASRLGESRGWAYRVRNAVRHGLMIALSSFAEGDMICHSQISAPLRERFIGVERVAEVLAEMGIYTDDRRPALDDWLERKLAALPPGISRDVTAWARALRDGTARSRARSPRTVNHYVASALPALAAWSEHYDHLREVTRDDILAIVGPQRGQQRNDTTQALRSLFRFAVKTRQVFRNPVTGLITRGNHGKVIQPLPQAGIDAAVAAVTTPAGRLVLGLAAVHAARKKAIREILLDDIDLGNRQLTIAGRSRPLDDLTRQLMLTWLAERRRR